MSRSAVRPYDRRMEVRTATLGDCSGIGEVHVDAWRIACRGEFPDDYLDGLESSERAKYWGVVLDRTVDFGSRLIVAEEAGGIVGFGCFGPASGVDGRGELYAMNVRPSHWRAGVGSLLLDSVSSQLVELGLPDALLWTSERNARAQAFYVAHGWAVDGMGREAEVHGISVAEVRFAKFLA